MDTSVLGAAPASPEPLGLAPEAAPPVSLIIPVHKLATAFPRCLAAIGRTSPPPAEVIVVCDGEVTEAAHLARAEGCRVIEMSGPRGPSRARNTGAEAALYPILFFVDSDVELPRTAVAQVWEHFQRDSGLTALFGSYDAEPSEPGFLSQYRNLLHHFVHQTSSADASTFWGACGAIRRGAFLAVGGFDESYLEPSVEDIELGYRLKAAGRPIRLDKTLQVKHLKHWGLRSTLRTDVLRRALPWGTLLLKRRGGAPDLNLRGASLWSVIVTGAMIASLLAGLWQHDLLLLCFPLGLIAIALNLPFYRFLLRKRGILFTLCAVPCHWLFYACGGLGLVLAMAGQLQIRAKRRVNP